MAVQSIGALGQALQDNNALMPDSMPAGSSASFCKSAAEGLLFRTLAPFVAEALPLSYLKSGTQLADLKRLLATPPPMDQTIPLGQHEVPDWSHVAPPVHLPVEKDRIRLQVSFQNMPLLLCMVGTRRLVIPANH